MAAFELIIVLRSTKLNACDNDHFGYFVEPLAVLLRMKTLLSAVKVRRLLRNVYTSVQAWIRRLVACRVTRVFKGLDLSRRSHPGELDLLFEALRNVCWKVECKDKDILVGG